MNNKLGVYGASFVAGLGLAGCGEKPKNDVGFEVNTDSCVAENWGLTKRCTTTGLVKDILLKGKAEYGIARVAGEKATGEEKGSDIDYRLKTHIDGIKAQVGEEVSSWGWARTDVEPIITSLTFSGNAVGHASNIGNFEKGIYLPGYGVKDTNNNINATNQNSVNATARCINTIDGVGKGLSDGVINNVQCGSEVHNLDEQDLYKLGGIGTVITEELPQFRNLSTSKLSPAISAFAYIKAVHSGNADLLDQFKEGGKIGQQYSEAVELVNSKHFVDVNGIQVDVNLSVTSNKPSNRLLGALGLLGLGGLIGLVTLKGRKK